jgi:3-hydroxyacyl-[acyl-carrier-protein] dehydratase
MLENIQKNTDLIHNIRKGTLADRLETIEIKDLLPHRDPFLFVSKIEQINEESIVTSFTFDNSMDIYKGHFPNFPITPGVLLCEGLMQSGAIFLNLTLEQEETKATQPNNLYVATRMNDVKFKNMVLPGSKVFFHVTNTEIIGQAYFFKGQVKSEENKTLCSMTFTCNLTTTPH